MYRMTQYIYTVYIYLYLYLIYVFVAVKKPNMEHYVSLQAFMFRIPMKWSSRFWESCKTGGLKASDALHPMRFVSLTWHIFLRVILSERQSKDEGWSVDIALYVHIFSVDMTVFARFRVAFLCCGRCSPWRLSNCFWHLLDHINPVGTWVSSRSRCTVAGAKFSVLGVDPVLGQVSFQQVQPRLINPGDETL